MRTHSRATPFKTDRAINLFISLIYLWASVNIPSSMCVASGDDFVRMRKERLNNEFIVVRQCGCGCVCECVTRVRVCDCISQLLARRIVVVSEVKVFCNNHRCPKKKWFSNYRITASYSYVSIWVFSSLRFSLAHRLALVKDICLVFLFGYLFFNLHSTSSLFSLLFMLSRITMSDLTLRITCSL